MWIPACVYLLLLLSSLTKQSPCRFHVRKVCVCVCPHVTPPSQGPHRAVITSMCVLVCVRGGGAGGGRCKGRLLPGRWWRARRRAGWVGPVLPRSLPGRVWVSDYDQNRGGLALDFLTLCWRMHPCLCLATCPDILDTTLR